MMWLCSMWWLCSKVAQMGRQLCSLFHFSLKWLCYFPNHTCGHGLTTGWQVKISVPAPAPAAKPAQNPRVYPYPWWSLGRCGNCGDGMLCWGNHAGGRFWAAKSKTELHGLGCGQVCINSSCLTKICRALFMLCLRLLAHTMMWGLGNTSEPMKC